MAASVTSPADVLNLALKPLGYKLRVGSLDDGSDAANAALDIYAQTRDALLRMSDWGFAEYIAVASLSGGAAPAPWLFEYTYPTDCMRLRNVFYASYIADQNDPLPSRYTEGNSVALGKVVWTKATAARLVYTRQVTNPAQWEPLFVEAFATQLGERLGSVLTGGEGGKMAMARSQIIVPLAEGVVG
jgi:hypothetical protein